MSRSAGAATALAILLVGAAPPLTGQAGVIQGHVVRADSPTGLADAELELQPSGARARSDARGFFVFRDAPSGPVEISVRRVGFAPAVVTLQPDALGVTVVTIPLDPVPTVLDPIITSVTRDERSLSELAAAVSVADTSALGRDRTVGLHETLRMMPGVQVSAPNGTDEVLIGIRGSAARGGNAVRGIGVLLDGIPLTEPDGVARLDLLELAASRQVEVVRGPASALYAGSPGGLVNVVSRSGRDSRGVSARALAGGFGFRKYDGHAGDVFAGGRGSWFSAASYTSGDGARAHSDGDVLRGQVAFDYVAAPGTRIAIQANGSRVDRRRAGSQTQQEFDTDPDAASPLAETFGFGRRDNRYRGGAKLEQVVGNGMASGYFFYGGRTLDFPIPFQIVDLNLHRVQGGSRVRANRLVGLPIDATIGLDYDNIFGTDQRWENNGGAHGDDHVDDGYFSVRNLGTYSQLEWQAAATASVTLGLRYDRVIYHFESYIPDGIPEQQRPFDQFSPRLSAVWNSGLATSLYASVGRGFEVPAIGELSASPSARLSESLRPKSLWNFEVGTRRIVGGGRMLLEGSVFYADVQGEFVPRAIDGGSLPENASRSRNIGVELGMTARVTDGIELVAGYTFTDIRFRDYTSALLDATGILRPVDFSGKLLPAVPRHRLTGEARVTPIPVLDLGMQVEWQGIMFVESGNADAGLWYFPSPTGTGVDQVPFRAVPSRALVHLSASWRLGPATLFGSVENLFGLRYVGAVVANVFNGQFYEAGPPRWVSVGLKVTQWGDGF